jgi:hypothetical protein
MTTKILDFSNIERKIFWTLAVMLGIFSIFYLYSVTSLTLAVVDRNNFNNTAREIKSVSSTLESEYLSQAGIITLAHAEDLGFREVKVRFANGTAHAETKLSMAR